MSDPTAIPKDTSPAVNHDARDTKTPTTSSSVLKKWIVRGLKAIWRNTDSITKWIQVVALVFAAVWTFLTFRETQAPSLETSAAVSAGMAYTWSPAPPTGHCAINVNFGVDDDGVKAFDVAYAQVRAWRTTVSTQSEGYRYLDIATLEKQLAPLATVRIDSSPLIGHYAPKTNLHDSFTWVFYGPPSDDLFFARIDIYDKSNGLLGQASAWTLGMCK